MSMYIYGKMAFHFVIAQTFPVVSRGAQHYRGPSLIRNTPLLGPYSRVL